MDLLPLTLTLTLTFSCLLFSSTSNPFKAPQGDHLGVQFVNHAATPGGSAMDRFARISSTVGVVEIVGSSMSLAYVPSIHPSGLGLGP